MRWCVIEGARGLGLVLGCASGAAFAQATEPGPGQAVAWALAASEPALAAAPAAPAWEPAALPTAAPVRDAPAMPAWRLPPLGQRGTSWGASSRPAAETPRLSVVEIEPELRPGYAPGRAHHALKVRAEWPRAALRSMGFAAAECTTQFRMPTSLGQGGGFGIEVRAQVRLACSY